MQLDLIKHKFAYLADGRKLLSLDKIKSNDNIDKDGGLAYIGSSVFKINEGKYDGFESTSFSAGRIVRSGSGYAVQYHITDHLGSVRAVLNQSMTVLEQNDYYPFGLRHPNSALKTTANRYRYNGKEEIAADATSDYGARQYSAEFCQWLQVDPLAEKRFGISPYNFCSGNPINKVDSDGRLDGDYYDTYGNWLYNDGIDDNKVYEVRQIPGFDSEITGSGKVTTKYIGQIEDVFITGDASSDRKIQKLHPAIRMKATNFIKDANAISGNTLIRVAEGFRTFEEQNALYAKGRTTDGSIVTNARGGYSNHNFGLAFDIVGITNGKIDYDLNWNKLSAIGKSQGFEWGGDWKSIEDKPHFQNMFGNTLKSLREKYNSGKLINGYIKF